MITPSLLEAQANDPGLQEILERHVTAGLCTHVDIAAGFLTEKTPRIRAYILPEGRHVFDLASLTKALVTTPLSVSATLDQGLDPSSVRLGALFENQWPLGLDERFQCLTL